LKASANAVSPIPTTFPLTPTASTTDSAAAELPIRTTVRPTSTLR
jgi:hypothetical protein